MPRGGARRGAGRKKQDQAAVADLSPKKQKYVAGRLEGKTKRQAAIEAGYSPSVAENAKHQIETPAVQRTLDEINRSVGVTWERVLAEAAKIAFFDSRRLFESDGSPKLIHQLDEDSAAAIAGLEVCELFEGSGDQKHAYGLAKKIKLASKLDAIKFLQKHLSESKKDAPPPPPDNLVYRALGPKTTTTIKQTVTEVTQTNEAIAVEVSSAPAAEVPVITVVVDDDGIEDY